MARAGFEPVVYDNLSEGHRWVVKWGPLAEADLSDRHALKQVIQQYNIAAAIHFAAPLNASPAFRSMFGQLFSGQATQQFWSQIRPVRKCF